jgi:hemerythrin-like domain-containing protein
MIHLPDPNKYNDPIRYFRDCHALIVTLINQLDQLTLDAEKTGIKKSIAEDRGWRDLLDFFVNTAPIHELDEEAALFPLIFEKIPHMGFQQNSSPIHFIHAQHEIMQSHSIDLLKIWKQTLAKTELTDDEANRFILGAKELAAIYREHVRRENEIIYTTANDELLSPDERERIIEKIRELHGREVISGVFDYDSPVFSDSAFTPIFVAGGDSEDAISQEEFEVEDENDEEE